MGDTPHTKSLPRLEFGGGHPEPFLKSVLKSLPLSCVCQTLFSGAVYWGREGVGEGVEFMLSMLACVKIHLPQVSLFFSSSAVGLWEHSFACLQAHIFIPPRLSPSTK